MINFDWWYTSNWY